MGMNDWNELKDKVTLYCEVRDESVTLNECLGCNKQKMPHPCWCATWLQHQIEERIKERLWGQNFLDSLRMTFRRWLSW